MIPAVKLDMATKHIAIYNDRDLESWNRVKRIVERKFNGMDMTEGEILGHIAEQYVQSEQDGSSDVGITDNEILQQLQPDVNEKHFFSDWARAFYSASEIASGLNITPQGVRYRLKKLEGDRVVSDEIAGVTYWKLIEQSETVEVPV